MSGVLTPGRLGDGAYLRRAPRRPSALPPDVGWAWRYSRWLSCDRRRVELGCGLVPARPSSR